MALRYHEQVKGRCRAIGVAALNAILEKCARHHRSQQLG
jgi:hypothetical protein